MDFLDIKVLLEELVQCCQSPDISVSEWAERWYGTYVANRDITEKSATMYRQKLKHYILPKIGDVPMREVTEIQLQEILNSSNSSKSTAQKVKIVMQAMFRRAKHRLTRAHREKQLKMSCQALHNAPPNRT